MEILGTKYQTYIDDELVVFRLVNIKSNNKYTVEDKDGKRITMTQEELNKCVKLDLDALLCLMITTGEDGYRDVYACVNRVEDMRAGYKDPVLILRQNIYSSSKNSFSIMDGVYVGECMTNINRTNDSNFKSLMEFKSIDYTLSVGLYVDDKFKDIKKFITGHNAKKFDEILRQIKSETEKTNSMIKGYCDSLEELFEENNFMYHYRSLFNITQIDFLIETGNNTSEDGVIQLDEIQIRKIEDLLRNHITDVKVLKYDKDIDISKIVGNTHIMLSDKSENIYLVSYVIVSPYEVDNDILKAMSIKK